MKPGISETKINVLVVDDDDCIREVLAILLSRIGYRCHSATNGIEAIQKVRDSKFDIVITDLQMPDMDGIALTKELCQHFPDLPVMIMTGKPDDRLVESAIGAGAREVLRKPFGISELKVRIYRMLRNQETPQEQEPEEGNDQDRCEAW